MKDSSPGRGVWRRILTDDGSSTLAHPEHGEACHSSAGARLESLERYPRGCDLPRRWRAEGDHRWRILDVGTGLGWNLAVTLEERALFEPARRPALELVTLEVSQQVLEAAFCLQRERPQGAALELVHAGLQEALRRDPGAVVELADDVHLALWLGDAAASLPKLISTGRVFDAIYLDPFSPRREPELWSLEFFRGLGSLAAPGARLATYSAATHVRAGLVAAGWQVGPAPRVGSKAEGTLARWGASSRGDELPQFTAKVTRRIERRAEELVASSKGTPR